MQVPFLSSPQSTRYWRPKLFILSYGAALLTGCSAEADQKKEKPLPPVPVITLQAADQRLYHEYVSDIQAERNVEVRAKVPGYLEKIFVDEGKSVVKGQPLFRIQPSEYQHQMARAQASSSSADADVAAAELQLQRVKLLVDKNIIAKSELDLAQTKLRAAQAHAAEADAGERSADLNLNRTLVRSPFDGVIDRIPLKTGSLIDEGTLLTTVSDLSEVFAYFNVAEGEYLEYAKTRRQHPEQSRSDTVTLVLADGSRYPYAGRIETMEGEFNENTGSIAFRARFPNPNRLLKHGATGRIRLANTVPNALLVPQKSVFEIQDKSFVYVVDAQNRVHSRHFKPGVRTADSYVVQEGLKPGDRVVLEGTQSLRDGDKIAPVAARE